MYYKISDEFRKEIKVGGGPVDYAKKHKFDIAAIRKYYKGGREMNIGTLLSVALSLEFEKDYSICKSQLREHCMWLVDDAGKQAFDKYWNKWYM